MDRNSNHAVLLAAEDGVYDGSRAPMIFEKMPLECASHSMGAYASSPISDHGMTWIRNMRVA
jgi:hypothetical protein